MSYCYCADQTPTPTRFLRSCEESGLFQELEEANPFDQDFNKTVNGAGSVKNQSKSAASECDEKCEIEYSSILL